MIKHMMTTNVNARVNDSLRVEDMKSKLDVTSTADCKTSY